MTDERRFRTVLVTGGAGYVGAVLTERLLARGYRVRVLDLFLFGEQVLDAVKDHPALEKVKGDIRDQDLLRKVLPGADAVIHLACISNDPSFELNPELGRSINYDAFEPLVRISKESGARRFIYASSSSVYGVSDAPEVTEDHPLAPITDYSRYKALCETVLLQYLSPEFVPVVIRPATVCGYSPRLRLDLTVNILTAHAVVNGVIKVFGGDQMRPNLHIDDMVDVYLLLLSLPDEAVSGKIYNAGYQNRKVADIARIVQGVVEQGMPGREEVRIVTTPSNDPRSYYITAEKIRREIGFSARRTIEDAVSGLVAAFREGKIPDPMTDIRYHNIKTMQHLSLK